MAKTTFEQLPMSNVSSDETAKLHAYAKTKGVLIERFPTGIMPTKGSIDHCAGITAKSETNTVYSLYFGSDRKVYVSPAKGKKSSKVTRDPSKPYTLSDVVDDYEWLFSNDLWITQMARANSALKAVAECSIKGNVVTMSLSNGQQFTLTIAEVKATPAK